MQNTDKKVDEKKGDDVLKRMLKTPPKTKENDEGQSPRPNTSEKDIKDGTDSN